MGLSALFSAPKVRRVPTQQETEEEIEDEDAEDKKRRRALFTTIATSVSGVQTEEANIGRRRLLGG